MYAGLFERYLLSRDTGSVTMEGPIHMDICQQRKNIIIGVPITVKLYPSDDTFRLMANSDVKYKVEITDAILKVCHVDVNPLMIVAHNEALSRSDALYPFQKSDVKVFGIPRIPSKQ